MLKNNIINKITVIFIWAPNKCKSKMAMSFHTRRQKYLWNLQPHIHISVILKIYPYHCENIVRKIKSNLMELRKC